MPGTELMPAAFAGKVRVLMINLLSSGRYPVSHWRSVLSALANRRSFQMPQAPVKPRVCFGAVTTGRGTRFRRQGVCDNLQALTTLTTYTCHEVSTDVSTALTSIPCSSSYCHRDCSALPRQPRWRTLWPLSHAILSVVDMVSQSNANLARNPTKSDAKTLLKDLRFLIWVDWSVTQLEVEKFFHVTE